MTRTLPGRLVLLGHPVAHSLSPRFQGAALARAGIPLRYEALDVAPPLLASTLQELRQVHAAGNVTVPHKVAVAKQCDRLTTIAARVAAVNTFWHEGDALIGDNTDIAGFQAMAESFGIAREGAEVALVGAGGAARAVCAAIEQWPGASIRLWSRRAEQAAELATQFATLVTVCRTVQEALHSANVVVNATPLGMRDDELPMTITSLPRDADVMDLVYRPGLTRWVREARSRGHRAADGREMLLWQGVRAFERWFGILPDVDVMRSSLDASASS